MTGAAVPRLRGQNALLLSGAVVVVAILSVNRLFAQPLLDLAGTDVSDAGVVAVAMTAVAACRSLWHWRCPLFRPLGAAFGLVTAYQIGVLVAYQPSSGAWTAFGKALLPSIPFAYAAWGSAALAISRRARGFEIGLASDWGRFGPGGKVLARWRVPRPALLWLWLPAMVFSGLSVVPGLVYSGVAVPGLSWQGQSYRPHLLYVVIGAWGITTLIGSALIAEHSWRTREPALGESDRLLVRGAVIVSFVASVCALVLCLSAATGFWPEPVIDLLLALFAVVYALGVTADSDSRAGAATWPPREHVLESALVIALSCLLAFTTSHGPPVRGLEAMSFAVLFTLIILSVKHVRGADRTTAAEGREPAILNGRVAGFTAAERVALRALLAGTTAHTLRLYVNSRPLLGRKRAQTGADPTADRSSPGSFAESLVGVLGATADARFLRLLYLCSKLLPDQPTAGRPSDPSASFVVAVQCHRRAPVTKDKHELERLRINVLMLRLFVKSQPKRGDRRPHYRFQGQIALMSEAELIEALELVKGREPGRPKGAARDLLEAGLGEILELLLDALSE